VSLRHAQNFGRIAGTLQQRHRRIAICRVSTGFGIASTSVERKMKSAGDRLLFIFDILSSRFSGCPKF
jgi:hypothetical protein